MPNYFFQGGAGGTNVSDFMFLMSNSTCLLLVYKKKIDLFINFIFQNLAITVYLPVYIK